jgi:hypothetical protein
VKAILPDFESAFTPEPFSGCWLWIRGSNSDGYGQITMNRKQQAAHRVSWQLYRGPIPEGMQILHSCDTPPCVNPAHLFLGKDKDNVQDSIKKDRHFFPKGEQHGRRKLSDADVREIRSAPKSYGTGMALAKRFGVTDQTISNIRCRRNWA